VEKVADPAASVETLWDEAWERNLVEAAMERVKGQVEPKEFQIFDLHVLREWPVAKVAETLRTTQAHVYYAKYKVARLIKKETKILLQRMS
jgi:RNA polymerase sigma-70 factor (ECF subfamily)